MTTYVGGSVTSLIDPEGLWGVSPTELLKKASRITKNATKELSNAKNKLKQLVNSAVNNTENYYSRLSKNSKATITSVTNWIASKNHKGDLCGSNDWTWVTPDQTFTLDMRHACSVHDELYNNHSVSKQEADIMLGALIIKDNWSFFDSKKDLEAMEIGLIYSSAVLVAGDNAWGK